MAVDSRYGGASHDSLVWSLSAYRLYLQQLNRNNENTNYWLLGKRKIKEFDVILFVFIYFYYILGDSGYPLEPWLITPFRATSEGSREAAFNTLHSKTRNIIERCIGILKSRFRCLLGARQLHYTPKKASQIVNVCTTLHNICLHFRVPLEQCSEVNINETRHYDNEANGDNENVLARQIRNNVLNAIVRAT